VVAKQLAEPSVVRNAVQSTRQSAVPLRRAIAVKRTDAMRLTARIKSVAAGAMHMFRNEVGDQSAMRPDVAIAIVALRNVALRIVAQSPAVRATVVQRRLLGGWLGGLRLARRRLVVVRMVGEPRVGVPDLVALDLLDLPLGQAVGRPVSDLHVVPLQQRAATMTASAAPWARQRLARAPVALARLQAWRVVVIAVVSVAPAARPVALTLIAGMMIVVMMIVVMTTAASVAWVRLQVAAQALVPWVRLQVAVVVLKLARHRVGMVGNEKSATRTRVARPIKIAAIARLSRQKANADYPRNAR
jgi:hypothetical protein